MEFLSKYKDVRKMLAAVLGVALMVVSPHMGVDSVITSSTIFGMSVDQVVQLLVGILTVVGVYKVPNGEVEEVEAE
jgi:hypothetical protein